MSKKEKAQTTEPKAEGTPAAGAAVGANPEIEATPETSHVSTKLEEELVKALTEAAEYKDGWQRAVADYQNLRRRVEAEKADTYQYAVGSIIKKYLPILDDLERALASCPAGLAWADGVELIYRKLKTILESEGLKRIEAEGKMFDPNFHEAIIQEPAEGVESGHVISVVQNGYMLGERVIRPAQVRVAK